MEIDLVVRRIARLYPMDGPPGTMEDEAIDCGAVAFSKGRVVWVGPDALAPAGPEELDGSGRIGLPGLVDPHTHSVWAGSRAAEFEARLAGATYTEILEAGGGILSTVTATRAATEEELAASCRARLGGMLRRGVTTVEIKSGYGLSAAHEARMLRAARTAGGGVRVIPTWLGAHTIPKEFRAHRARYVQELIDVQLPACAPLAESVDVYCDRGAFDLDEAVAVLEAGRAAGLRIRAHAEQVAFTGIAGAAARLGATAVDHLERIDEAGIAALARYGTVAVLLPGAQLYLRDSAPPVAAMREAGVRLAVGTDLNPGSSPLHDLWTAATLACLLQGLTVEEAMRGITVEAGRALGHPELGRLAPGLPGDLILVAPPPGEPVRVAPLIQHMGAQSVIDLVRDGRRLSIPAG